MLSIRNLEVTGSGHVPILRGVSLDTKKGKCVGLTGPSGAGKATLIRSILGMDVDSLTVAGGSMMLGDTDVLALKSTQRRALCGKTFGFIPQTPMTAFFYNAKIGRQMTESFMLQLKLDKNAALTLASEMLRQVNLPDTQRILSAYPVQLSGGMLQRVAMAIILGAKPAYILADEPTSALDRDNRDLLLKLLQNLEDVGVLFLSHDAQAMRLLCCDTYVMQDGVMIEAQPTEEIFASPRQPWTRAFVGAAWAHQKGAAEWKELRP